MKIGIVREIKQNENRVALTPEHVSHLTISGHQVVVESDAGVGSGFCDKEYTQSGAQIVSSSEAWQQDLVLKVKEPIEEEYAYLQGQILFTYLHLAGVDRLLTQALLDSKTTAIAYETVEDISGRLPLLAPMSAVAGSMAVTMGNYFLAKFNNGRGNLLSELLGNAHGKVVIIGDGVVGQHAAKVAIGLGTKEVVLMGQLTEQEQDFHRIISPKINYRYSTPETVADEILQADLVVGAVLLRGKRAPHVVTESMVRSMQLGSVIVDVSIDQGGCIETSRPTTHSEPVYIKHDVVHYCVTNMPGAYPRTSTVALTNATWPYIEKLSKLGLQACLEDPGFMKGINTHAGHIANRDVAQALGITYKEDQLLSQF